MKLKLAFKVRHEMNFTPMFLLKIKMQFSIYSCQFWIFLSGDEDDRKVFSSVKKRFTRTMEFSFWIFLIEKFVKNTFWLMKLLPRDRFSHQKE